MTLAGCLTLLHACCSCLGHFYIPPLFTLHKITDQTGLSLIPNLNCLQPSISFERLSSQVKFPIFTVLTGDCYSIVTVCALVISMTTIDMCNKLCFVHALCLCKMASIVSCISGACVYGEIGGGF